MLPLLSVFTGWVKAGNFCSNATEVYLAHVQNEVARNLQASASPVAN